MALMEVQNKLSLEINRAEFLDREVLLLEAENKRFENVFVEYLKVLGVLEFSRSRNEKLHVKFKKLLRRSKQQHHVLRRQRLEAEFQEKEISKDQKELEAKDNCIKTMQDEIREMKTITRLLQEEKDELSNKLKAAQESATTKEGETVALETYNELAREVERIQKDEAAQVRELIYLRWCNACLKHELMRKSNDEQEHEKMGETNEVEISFGGIEEIQGFGSDNELNRCARVGAHSRRRKLLAKFKRWVEGSEKTKHNNLDETGEHHGNKCLRRQNSFSYGGEETCFPARKSCSSA